MLTRLSADFSTQARPIPAGMGWAAVAAGPWPAVPVVLEVLPVGLLAAPAAAHGPTPGRPGRRVPAHNQQQPLLSVIALLWQSPGLSDNDPSTAVQRDSTASCGKTMHALECVSPCSRELSTYINGCLSLQQRAQHIHMGASPCRGSRAQHNSFLLSPRMHGAPVPVLQQRGRQVSTASPAAASDPTDPAYPGWPCGLVPPATHMSIVAHRHVSTGVPQV